MVVRILVRSRVGVRLTAAVLAAATSLSTVALVVDQSTASAAGTPSRVAVVAGSGLAQVVSAAAATLHPQAVEPAVTLTGSLDLSTAADRRRKISLTSSKGSRTFTASSLAEHDLPSAAMRAYKNAARNIDASQPGCRLPWTLLAGIGRVESDHGRYGGSVLGADGVPRPAIVGVALDGKGPVAAIRDTDGGRFDGDKVWDRAVGPMQFIPSTWRTAGRDGDGDGVKSPNDIDDAALAAAAYLCRGGRDLAKVAGQRAAVFGYNPSTYYVDLVSAFARGYRTGTFVIPSPPVAPGAGDGVVPVQGSSASAASKAAKAAATAAKAEVKAKAEKDKAGGKGGGDTVHVTAPKPPKPASTPKPSKTVTTVVSGPLASPRRDTWAVGGTTFTTAQTAGLAPADLDGDGDVEAVADELAGVVERQGVTKVTIRRTGSAATVVAVSVTSLAPVPTPSAAPTPGPSLASASPSTD